MVEGSSSDSASDEKHTEKSSSEELEKGEDGGGDKGVTEYEKQRLSRISENRARLESLGLPRIASSVSGSSVKREAKGRRKGKGKRDEDDEYKPPSDVEARASSSSEEEEDDDEEDDDFQLKKCGSSSTSRRRRRRGSALKGKNIRTPNSKITGKKGPARKNESEPDFVDDDEALRQAIALSLQSSSEVPGALPCQSSRTDATDSELSKRRGAGNIKDSDGRRKRKTPNASRVQMTEDQVILHFFQFDEAGNGNISRRDLRRVARAHDFSWTDDEIAAMIHCFDNDGDGKVLLFSNCALLYDEPDFACDPYPKLKLWTQSNSDDKSSCL